MRRALPELVSPDWAEALEPVSDTIATMGDFLRAEIAAGRQYLPAGQHVLRAFAGQLLDQHRVAIIPIHGHSRASAVVEGELAAAIDEFFGSFDKFVGHFSAAANSLQGSGWAALVWDSIGERLRVE